MEVRQAPTTAVSGSLLRYLVIGGGALVMVGLLLAAPAFACGPSTSASANPSHAVAGSSVNVFGNAFGANLPIEIRWGGADGTLLASGTATGEGSYAASVTIPADAGVGTHTMWVGQPVEGGRTFAFNFAVVAPVEAEPAPEPVTETDPEPAPEPVTETDPEPAPAPAQPVTETAPAPAPAQPVTETDPEPAPAQPWTAGPLPAGAPAVGGQSPAPAATAPTSTQRDAAPAAPAATSTTTRSQLATSSPAPEAPASEPAPERELVGAAAEASSPSTTQRSLLAGAGITTPEASTAPAEASVAEAAPSTSDAGAASPADAGGTTPWALVPLMLLAAGLLAASGAALTTEVRQRAKAKA